jgi:hypothetical protein
VSASGWAVACCQTLHHRQGTDRTIQTRLRLSLHARFGGEASSRGMKQAAAGHCPVAHSVAAGSGKECSEAQTLLYVVVDTVAAGTAAGAGVGVGLL